MKIARFEEIQAWVEARELVREIYHSFQECRDFAFNDQIHRAGISIMSNIAEGFDRNTNKEFVNFLLFARGSCAETKSLLYAALDIGYVNENVFVCMSGRISKISGLINGFISYLKTKSTTR
jgi:four helix bundle protein